VNRKTYHGPEAPAIFGLRRLSDNLAGAAMAVFTKLMLETRGIGDLAMRISTVVICAFVIGGALALEGCGHKLVAHNGDSTVAVYPDENTFVKLTNLKNQGGVGGMIGGLGEGIAAKQVDNNTPVRIINSDDKGSQVEVLDGAFKGLQGFVPQDNVH
jgi:hypothetical protein